MCITWKAFGLFFTRGQRSIGPCTMLYCSPSICLSLSPSASLISSPLPENCQHLVLLSKLSHISKCVIIGSICVSLWDGASALLSQWLPKAVCFLKCMSAILYVFDTDVWCLFLKKKSCLLGQGKSWISDPRIYHTLSIISICSLS